VRAWIAAADSLISTRITYVEVWRAISLWRSPDTSAALAEFEWDWMTMARVEVDDDLVREAARLTARHDLRSLDAIHLASALTVTSPQLRVMVFDARLRRAADAVGLAMLPP
jgi:predicted nucleic acid-binding protein